MLPFVITRPTPYRVPYSTINTSVLDAQKNLGQIERAIRDVRNGMDISMDDLKKDIKVSDKDYFKKMWEGV